MKNYSDPFLTKKVDKKGYYGNEFLDVAWDCMEVSQMTLFTTTKVDLYSFGFVLWMVKDTLQAYEDFKNKQKSVWSNVFPYVKVCIFWKCIQYTIHWDKTQILKKLSFGQNKRYKKCFLFSFANFNSSQFYF